jgi:O-antigen biosynthesis protein WbqV
MEVVLRAIETGTVRKIQPRGILSPRPDDLGQSIRGVPVLGDFGDLDQVVQDFHERGIAIRRLVATPGALAPEAHPDMLIARARRLGLPLSRVTSLGEGMRSAELAPLEIEDLLLRPTVQIDRGRLESFMRDKRVLVTGGGGFVGSNLVRRLLEEGDDVRVGDMIGFDISHPCLTFDKWRHLVVLDASWRAIDVVQTYF